MPAVKNKWKERGTYGMILYHKIKKLSRKWDVIIETDDIDKITKLTSSIGHLCHMQFLNITRLEELELLEKMEGKETEYSPAVYEVATVNQHKF
jgi:hypothetical protein